MKYLLLALVLAGVGIFGLAGLRGSMSRRPPIEVFPDMDRQAKLRPQTQNNFFPDQLSSQAHIEGTVARGSRYESIPVNTGMVTGTTNFVETLPVVVNAQLMARGQQRYTIYCTPCHGAIGDGKGITSKYGMVTTANLHDKRIVALADGDIFNTITHGKNTMGPYGGVVPVEDRWAIIAYLRALQLSRLATTNDVPASVMANLKK